MTFVLLEGNNELNVGLVPIPVPPILGPTIDFADIKITGINDLPFIAVGEEDIEIRWNDFTGWETRKVPSAVWSGEPIKLGSVKKSFVLNWRNNGKWWYPSNDTFWIGATLLAKLYSSGWGGPYYQGSLVIDVSQGDVDGVFDATITLRLTSADSYGKGIYDCLFNPPMFIVKRMVEYDPELY